jgi:hypothetical protein
MVKYTKRSRSKQNKKSIRRTRQHGGYALENYYPGTGFKPGDTFIIKEKDELGRPLQGIVYYTYFKQGGYDQVKQLSLGGHISEYLSGKIFVLILKNERMNTWVTRWLEKKDIISEKLGLSTENLKKADAIKNSALAFVEPGIFILYNGNYGVVLLPGYKDTLYGSLIGFIFKVGEVYKFSVLWITSLELKKQVAKEVVPKFLRTKTVKQLLEIVRDNPITNGYGMIISSEDGKPGVVPAHPSASTPAPGRPAGPGASTPAPGRPAGPGASTPAPGGPAGQSRPAGPSASFTPAPGRPAGPSASATPGAQPQATPAAGTSMLSRYGPGAAAATAGIGAVTYVASRLFGGPSATELAIDRQREQAERRELAKLEASLAAAREAAAASGTGEEEAEAAVAAAEAAVAEAAVAAEAEAATKAKAAAEAVEVKKFCRNLTRKEIDKIARDCAAEVRTVVEKKSANSKKKVVGQDIGKLVFMTMASHFKQNFIREEPELVSNTESTNGSSSETNNSSNTNSSNTNSEKSATNTNNEKPARPAAASAAASARPAAASAAASARPAAASALVAASARPAAASARPAAASARPAASAEPSPRGAPTAASAEQPPKKAPPPRRAPAAESAELPPKKAPPPRRAAAAAAPPRGDANKDKLPSPEELASFLRRQRA